MKGKRSLGVLIVVLSILISTGGLFAQKAPLRADSLEVGGNNVTQFLKQYISSNKLTSGGITAANILTAAILDSNITMAKLSATVHAAMGGFGTGTYGPDDVTLEFALPDSILRIKAGSVAVTHLASALRDSIFQKNFFDVRDYGAIPGDAVSDITGMQAAADAVNANNGGTLFYYPGQYEFYGDSVRIYSNTTVWAYGVIFNDTTGGEFFFMSGASDVFFKGGEWDGNADIDGGYSEHDHGISITNSFRVSVEDVYMHDLGGDGVYFADVDYGSVTNSTIISTHLQESPFIGRNGIAVVEGDNFIFADLFLEGGDPANIDIEPNENKAITNVLIDNVISNGGQYGFSFAASQTNATSDSLKIIHCAVSNTTEIGIRIQGATHWEILYSSISSSGYDGIHIRPGGAGILGRIGRIIGNKVYNSGQGGAAAYHGILLNQSLHDITIMDNEISYSEGSGIRIAGSSGSENKWITAIDNIMWNNDRNDGGSNGGLSVNYTDSSFFEGNNAYDNRGGSATQTYGFIFSQMDDNYIGLGNFGYGNKTRLYSWSNMSGTRLNQMSAYSWIIDNIAAAQSNVFVMASGSESVTQIAMPWDGQIIGMTVTTTASLDAGTATFKMLKNGSTSGMNSIVLTSADSVIVETYFTYTDANHSFSAGDVVGVTITTDAGYLPVTLDFVVSVIFRY